jgi:hypothetical protein
MLLLLAVTAAVPLQFHFDASEFVNAVYHTACVTGRLHCSHDLYQRFWNEKYQATPEDRSRFDEFGKIFDDLESAAAPAPPTLFLPNDFANFPAPRVRQRMVAAALGSKSAAEFRRRAAATATPAQTERLAAILEHFQRRLRPWWVATGQPIVKQRLAGIERRFRALGVPGLAAEVAGFLETRPDFRNYYLHVVPSPEYDGKEAMGTAASNQFCLEILREFNPDDFAWVAVHEFTHSIYDQAPQDRKDALMRQFVESGDPSAHPFYMYLNEAMATGVELLLMDRQGKKLDDPYSELYVPRLGKAVLPLLRTALAERRTLYGGFTESYLAAGRRALGEEADQLQFRFSCVALLGDDDIRDAFLKQLPLRYVVKSQQEWSRFARLDGILLAPYDQIRFGGGDPEIEGLMRTHRGFVYIRRKGEHTDVFMLGRDKAAVEELGKMWAASKERAREGLIYAID